ncbi:MAG: hypothetical protein Q7T83_10605 [Thermodesulfovibrionales bacterium]|nr:hypothetical protein [Thermodesulfovibrionales bacterium]MDP3259041.1 hypothetical protein [Thermodesulfovibrionales bacterium]
MITHDGYSKKMCYLDGDNILIDGESYPITSIKQTEKYRSRMTFVFVLVLLMTAFVAYGGYKGIQQDIINNNDATDRLVKAAFWLFIFSLPIPLWWAVVKFGYKDCSTCRSFWILNGKGVYVEQNDDIGIEQNFREIELKLSHTGTEEIKAGSASKSNNKEKWLSLVVWGFFFCVVALSLSNYLKENIFVPLLLFAVALIFILRFYSLKKDYDNLKWKK